MRPVKPKICIKSTTLPFVKMLPSRELQSYLKKKKSCLHFKLAFTLKKKKTFSIVFKMLQCTFCGQLLSVHRNTYFASFYHFNNNWSQRNFILISKAELEQAKNHLSSMLYLWLHRRTLLNMPVLLLWTLSLMWAVTCMLSFGNNIQLFAQFSYSLPVFHKGIKKMP